MKIKKKTVSTVFHKEFDRVKFSLCGQHWDKYASVVNIQNALLFIYDKNARQCAKYYGIVQNVEHDYLRLLYFCLLFLLCSW